MKLTRFLQTVLVVTMVTNFVFVVGASAADQKIRVKVPGIT